MANKNFVVHNGLTAGNVTIDAASGNVTATKFIGDGSNLTNIPAGSLAGTAESINVSGNATVGNLLVTNKVAGDLIPSANITYTLGDRTHQWKDLYVGPGSIYVNGQKVLEQSSDTVIFSADPNQNIAIRTLGTGDVEINPANTGIIAFKGAVQFDDAYNFSTTSGGPVPFTTGLKVPSITAYGTNATLTLAGTGTGSISLNDDVTVTGNLTVTGTTTALNVTNLSVQDNIINISNGTTGTPTLNSGLQVMRGDEPNVQFRWNESIDRWQFTNDGLNYGNILASTEITSIGTLGSLSVTGNVSAGGFSGAHYGSGAGLTSIPNSALNNSSVTVNGTAVSLGGTATIAANAATLTSDTLASGVTKSSLTQVGTIATGVWQGTAISNSYLANSSLTINGTAVSLGGSATVTANAATLTGTALNSTVVASSLTSVGNLTALTVTGAATVGSVAAGNISIGATADAITSSGTLTLDPNPTGSGGLVVIQGNLQVTGTTTTVNSTTVEVADLNITLAKDAATAAAANGAGLTVAGASATFTYASTGDQWISNKPLDVTGNVVATAFSGSGAYLTAVPNGALTNSSITVNGTSISLGGSETVTADAATLTGTALNSTVVASSLTSVGNLTSLSVAGTASIYGNLTFTGTGNRITGDFSNATIASRVMFQTSTANSATSIYILPNGTSPTSQFVAVNNSDPTNASVLQLQVNATDYQIRGGITGTGTYLPMTFYTGGSEQMRIGANGKVLVGRTGLFAGSETFVSNGFGAFGSDSAPQVLIGNTGSGRGVLGTYNNYDMEFRTNNQERMRIDTSGNLTVTGAIIVNSSNNVTAIVNGGTSGTGNIGASGATFNTIFARATTAQYADLAEKYAADAEYEPGTVLCFGGSAEVTVCDHDADRKVAGVVTTNPAYMMNDAIEAEYSAAIALQGRVPCKVVGPVALGDMLVSAGAGRARAEADPKVGSVIGKALATHADGEGVIEVAVGRF